MLPENGVSEGKKGGIRENVADLPPGCDQTHPQSPVPVPSHILHFGARNVTQTTVGKGGREGTAGQSCPMPGPSASPPGRPEAHSPAHGDGEVEHAEHSAPLVCHEEVGDERGRDGGVTGFPDPHQAPSQEEQPELLGKETGWGVAPTLLPASHLPHQPVRGGRGGGKGRGFRVGKT